MLKRCNYYMILIIFMVNTSEFAYIFFKLGEVTQGGSGCLSSSHRVAFALNSLSQTGGERLLCNYLYVSSVTFMSVTV